MVEDVLKTKSSAGPDDNNRLQVDVRFLDRERLREVARAAVARCDFLKLGKLLRADTLRLRVFWISGSGTGTADSSDCVYGW